METSVLAEGSESAFAFFSFVAAITVIVMANIIRRRELEGAWRRAAEKTGGSLELSGSPVRPILRCLIDGFPATIEFRDAHCNSTRLRVDLRDRPPATAELDWRIVPALRSLCGLRAEGVTIDLSSDALELRVPCRLSSEPDLVAMAEGGARCVRHLFLLSSNGIEWMEGPPGDQVPCPVCGSVLKDPIVRCQDCDLPHHLDCWRYNGRCSTYACNGRRAA